MAKEIQFIENKEPSQEVKDLPLVADSTESGLRILARIIARRLRVTQPIKSESEGHNEH